MQSAVRRWLAARKRDLHIVLVDRGYGPVKPRGSQGVAELGHRNYVGRGWDEMGELQLRFLIGRGLQPGDVLCDIGCGSLRGGRHFMGYLDRGHYLGLDPVAELIDRGLKQEIDPDVVSAKAPELVVSDCFEFRRFSKVATVAWAASVFTHLSGDDITLCLTNLREWTQGNCVFYTTFFESPRPVRNYRDSHPHLGFCYTRQEMASFGQRAGWRNQYIGPWGDTVGQQMMMCYQG